MLILFASRVLVLCGHALVIHELALRLTALSLAAALRVHDRRVLVHNRVLLSGGLGTLEARVVSDGIRLGEEGEERVPRWLPLDRELLEVDDFVGVHKFFNKVAGLGIVHCPDLLNALVVSLFEPLETLLQLDELISEQLILLGQLRVPVLGFSDLDFEGLEFITILQSVFLEPRFETLPLLSEDLLTFTEHLEVENKLLIIESVDGLHVFHALLKDLHLSLKLDLLFGLLVRILTHYILQLFSVESFLLLAFLQEVRLDHLVLLKECFNFFLVAAENGGSFTVKVSLNLLELLVIVFTHLTELVFHAGDERVNVLRHLLDGLDVVAVLRVNLHLELLDQLLLV